VTSFNRPGGNVTGVNYLSSDLAPKRLGLLRELVPAATLVAVLVNPENVNAHGATKEVQAAADGIGCNIEIFRARNKEEIDKAFAALVQRKPQALLVINDSVFTGRRVQLVTLAARHAVPSIYTSREFVEVGGLMAYGTNLADAQRQVGVYAARILKGEKPADLPVQRATKFEFVINLQTARTLSIAVPPTLLAQADEAIE
jgi:putative ABC transport system substrate-binding protein